jgi:hypothetical protein
VISWIVLIRVSYLVDQFDQFIVYLVQVDKIV